MSDNRRVIKNLLMVVSSEGIGGVLSFIIVLISARLLGVSDFGVFSYILAITSVSQLIADFGLTNLIVREISKDRDRAGYIMSNVLSLAWILALIMLIVVALIGWFTLDSMQQKWAAILMGVAVLATFHSVVYSSVCRGFERMEYNAISFVAHKIILLLLILYFAGEKSPVADTILGITLSYLIANLFQYAYFFIVVRSRFLKFGFGSDFHFAWKLIMDALPIGVSLVIRRLSLHVDVLILTLMASSVSVGIFTSAYKIVQMIDMIPFALCLPLYPALSRLANTDRQKLNQFFAKSLQGFLLLALPITGYLFLLAETMISVFYGPEYAAASDILKILSFSITGLFVNMLLGYLFISLNKQAFYLIASFSCLFVNALVDFITIPYFDALGAAYGTISGEIVYFLFCVFYLRKVDIHFAWLRQTWKPVLLTIAVVILCSQWSSNSIGGLIIISMAYFALYIPGLFLFRVITREDVKTTLLMLRREPVKPVTG